MLMIAALDEAIINADVTLALALHAMPAAWLVAFGLVVIGASIMRIVTVGRLRAVLTALVGSPIPGGSTRMQRERRAIVRQHEVHPRGARGARSPGRGLMHPALHG
ncbi:MAG: hypothetical protein JST33_13780 [Actinobacteria bacterium]|nr:hypothetical protein [Actinomycetota bacterium]